MGMPLFRTERLTVRPFTSEDLAAAHRLLDPDCGCQGGAAGHAECLRLRERWLRWTELGYDELDRLRQPPLGDRAVELRGTGELVGAVGYVPCLMPFGQLPSWSGGAAPQPSLRTVELGLYWAVLPEYRGRGYAGEAAAALIDYAFTEMGVRRLVATTENSNAASLRVMEKLGMRVERNPLPEPPYLQAVGILEHPAAR